MRHSHDSGEPRSELGYTRQEILSYIPTGWSIYPGERGRFDPRDGVFTLRVLDGAEMDWKLAVKGDAAREHGRLEALRLAFDELYRTRLG
jgi:hypothetical protein